MAKYRLLRETLLSDGLFHFDRAPAASLEDIARVHNPAYVSGFLNGTLPEAQIRRIGFPWSPGLVQRTLASVGGTLHAAEDALERGWGGVLAGGTHHAFHAEGAGFCVFNDIAIAVCTLLSRQLIEKAAVVDLDVHQGDGTAKIFESNPHVFTLSIHGQGNFPARKQRSSLDVALPDGTRDSTYLDVLSNALEGVWAFQPDVVIFQAGVDTLATDRLGRLALSLDGIRQRDETVLRECRDRGIPCCIVIGGGYSEPVELTVEAHASAFRTAASLFRE